MSWRYHYWLLGTIVSIAVVLGCIPSALAQSMPCEHMCPGPTDQFLEALDTRPIEQLAPPGGKALRGFVQAFPLPPLLAIEIVQTKDGSTTLTLRMLSQEGAPHLIVRSAPVGSAVLRDLWIGMQTAQSAIADRRLREHGAREVVVCTADGPTAFVEYQEPNRTAVRVDNDCPSDEVFDAVYKMGSAAVRALADCASLGRADQFGDLRTLWKCTQLQGERVPAGEVLNRAYDQLISHEIDRANLRALFAPNARLRWYERVDAAGPDQCTDEWLRIVQDEAARHGQVYVQFESFFGQRPFVSVTGSVIVSRNDEDNPEYVAPLEMMWRRSANGTWQIVSWVVGPLRNRRVNAETGYAEPF